jgi:hypothetical protein
MVKNSENSRDGISRRRVLTTGGSGLLATAAVTAGPAAAAHAAALAAGRPDAGRQGGGRHGGGPDGTPEQVHLTWGEDPAHEVVVSWASPGPAAHPRATVGQRVIPAEERAYADGVNGVTVYTYHARIGGLRSGATYGYSVTADNDANAADPFSATFTTAPQGRAAFRFTSFGDLATPNAKWTLSYAQAAYAVTEVEEHQPLFHLLNGDLCYADLNPASQPQVWRDFGNNVQASAANRPWMPVPGNHEIEFNNGPEGYLSYLTRFTLPRNGSREFHGLWYSFRVGSVLFVCLNGDDVAYQDAGAFVAGPSALAPAAGTGNPPIQPGTSLYINGYSRGEQTRWLEETLKAARADDSIDWIIAQMHQTATSTSVYGNGSEKGIREQWYPLFDKYEVDLVLCGHEHDYERTFPTRGFERNVGTEVATGATVDTLRPVPVTTQDSGVFDTGKGTVTLVIGVGGTAYNLDSYGLDKSDGLPLAKVITKPNNPAPVPGSPGVFARAGADAVEDAPWSARRDTETGYGIAVFDVEPGTEGGGRTSITVTYYHALGADNLNLTTFTTGNGTPTGDYTELERFILVRPRSDCREPRG